jgi:hypothetical protein
MRRALAVPLLAFAFASAPALAFEVDGVGPGASEADVRATFPSAYCKPLEWKSLAAERRCDDARISFAGIEARVTFFLHEGTVQGFQLRFAARDRPRVAAALKSQWGAPSGETRDLIQRKGQKEAEVYKMTWVRGRDQATLTWRPERKRSWLMISRGGFAEEIYRVR